MNFSFLSPAKIIIGENESLKLSDHVAASQNVLLFHGKSIKSNTTFGAAIIKLKACCVFHTFEIKSGEPTPEMVDEAASFARKIKADVVIGIGGGSVLDIAKAASALVTNEGDVIDYLEGVGTGKTIINPPCMFISLPTTSGTGTEVTKNSVVSSIEKSFKKSMRDDAMIASITIIDYTLTYGLPKDITAYSGMDAICQLIESYTTKSTNSITDALSLHHAKLAVDAIKSAYDNDDPKSREIMSISAMVSGLCLANAGLGMAHGVAAGLGATFGVPHGFACGLLLPHAMRFNYNHGYKRYADLGRAFRNHAIDDDDTACNFAINRIAKLNASINIPADLKDLNINASDIEKIAHASMGSSMSKNPIHVSIEDCISFLNSLI